MYSLSGRKNFGVVPTNGFVLRFAEKPPLHQEPQGLHGVIVIDGILQFHGVLLLFCFIIQDTRTGAAEHSCARMFYLEI